MAARDTPLSVLVVTDPDAETSDDAIAISSALARGGHLVLGVRAGEFGASGASPSLAASAAQAPPLSLPDETGYKLWLCYAPPGAAFVAAYRQAVRQVLVEGQSATARIPAG